MVTDHRVESCFVLLTVFIIHVLLMSEEDRVAPGPSGLESTESFHSSSHPLLAPEDIQRIAGVVAGMLRSSSASPLAIPPTLPATTTAALTATNTTISHAGII